MNNPNQIKADVFNNFFIKLHNIDKITEEANLQKKILKNLKYLCDVALDDYTNEKITSQEYLNYCNKLIALSNQI